MVAFRRIVGASFVSQVRVLGESNAVGAGGSGCVRAMSVLRSSRSLAVQTKNTAVSIQRLEYSDKVQKEKTFESAKCFQLYLRVQCISKFRT